MVMEPNISYGITKPTIPIRAAVPIMVIRYRRCYFVDFSFPAVHLPRLWFPSREQLRRIFYPFLPSFLFTMASVRLMVCAPILWKGWCVPTRRRRPSLHACGWRFVSYRGVRRCFVVWYHWQTCLPFSMVMLHSRNSHLLSFSVTRHVVWPFVVACCCLPFLWLEQHRSHHTRRWRLPLPRLRRWSLVRGCRRDTRLGGSVVGAMGSIFPRHYWQTASALG